MFHPEIFRPGDTVYWSSLGFDNPLVAKYQGPNPLLEKFVVEEVEDRNPITPRIEWEAQQEKLKETDASYEKKEFQPDYGEKGHSQNIVVTGGIVAHEKFCGSFFNTEAPQIVVELIVLRMNGGIVETLLFRPDDAPYWRGKHCTPGHVMVKDDQPTEFVRTFDHIRLEKLGGMQVTPMPAGKSFIQEERGAFVLYTFWCEAPDVTGTWFSIEKTLAHPERVAAPHLSAAVQRYQETRKL